MAIRTFSSNFAELSPAHRRRSLDAALRARPCGGEVWLFGYGGLMWDDLAQADERRPARLPGWHRSLCVWSALARGRPERPGICLGLDQGGVCDGLALRVAGPDLARRLGPVWEREIWTDIYRPQWLSLETGSGPLSAIAFTVDRASRQFAGGLSEDEIAEHIAAASGEKGSCRDYLAEVLARLDAFKFSEPALQDMLARVDAHPAAG